MSKTRAPNEPRDSTIADAADASGLAHLAAVSYLGSRLAPTGGYWVALAGGVAVARAAARHGLRVGFGASMAGLVQSVAIMGPARLSIPLTQAVSAPLVGALESRRAPLITQIAVAALVRMALAVLATAFFIWIILGGLDAYAGAYEWMTNLLGWLPEGEAGALVLSAVTLLAWTLVASPIQVLVYRRGMRRWPSDTAPAPDATPVPAGERARRALDPRAVTLAAAIASALLLSSSDWPLLAAVVAWLALAWAVARPERDFVPVGAAIALVLAVSAFVVGLLADLGLFVSLERAVRAALLVAVATWFRAAAGTGGIREVARRVLGRLRRVLPGAREASRMLGDLGSGAVLLPAGRALLDELREVRHRPRPLLDAVLGWVVEESRGFRPAAASASPRLGLRPLDIALVALSTAPLAALVTGVAGLGSA
ncbi:MAG: hypothetical protein ACR2ML_14395 [Solirubrobacteraceae bacterium]